MVVIRDCLIREQLSGIAENVTETPVIIYATLKRKQPCKLIQGCHFNTSAAIGAIFVIVLQIRNEIFQIVTRE